MLLLLMPLLLLPCDAHFHTSTCSSSSSGSRRRRGGVPPAPPPHGAVSERTPIRRPPVGGVA